MEKHCSSSKKVINVISKRVYHFVCHCELSLLFKGIMATSHCCHEWGTPPFVQNHPIQVNGRCSVACLRESLMLEARGSSTLFSILNSVCCLREYCLCFSVFMGEEHHLCTKSHHRIESKKHCSLVRESLMLEAKAFSYLFTIVKSVAL
jgi:hypothetical protein